MTHETFNPSSLCASCGKCCKNMPGGYLPDDFGIDLAEGVRQALASGRVAIDWWEGGSPTYYLRPATKGKEGKLYDPSWGGECTFLTESGCSLSRDQMPTECKVLKPGVETCTSTLGKQGTAKAWFPYQSIIELIANEVEG